MMDSSQDKTKAMPHGVKQVHGVLCVTVGLVYELLCGTDPREERRAVSYEHDGKES